MCARIRIYMTIKDISGYTGIPMEKWDNIEDCIFLLKARYKR